MPSVNEKRVLEDLYNLRKIGTYKTGVHRPTLTEDDMRARRWLKDELSKIGHDAQIDGIANVIGFSPASGPKLICGSHLETQNHAGWLDGALGVVYALEAARYLQETGAEFGVDVIAFSDEEGHFGELTGSNSLIGNVTEDMLDIAVDRTSGKKLRDALSDNGLSDVPRVILDADRYVGMFEAHIEQGPSLENDNKRIGIVTSIVGSWQYKLTAIGAQNHAGTTRMDIRKDAGAALMRIYNAIFEKISARCWT